MHNMKKHTANTRVLKTSPADRPDTRTQTTPISRNQYGRDNVNVAQGPGTGNESAHPGKREDFRAAKAEREPLADMVMSAFGARGRDVAGDVRPGLEPIAASNRHSYASSKNKSTTK